MSTQPATARLFYLTEPAPGVPIVTLQVGEQTIQAEVTLNQLALIVADGAAMSARREAQR